jgi:hypothetical protein
MTDIRINVDTLTASPIETAVIRSANIVDGTIVNADINDSAAIAITKIAGTAVTLAGTQSLTNKTLTSPTITSPTISGTITGAVIASANIVDGAIVDADINASAAIAWSKINSASLKGTETVTLADAGTYSYGSKTITVPSGSTLVATIASSSYSGADDYTCIVSVSGTTGTIKVRCGNDSVVGDVTVNWIAL